MDFALYSEPIGEHFVQVCTTTPCMLRGAYDILDAVCQDLGGIKPGETTKDGKFTVIEVECQGACSNAPMLVVGDDFYVRAGANDLGELRDVLTRSASHFIGGFDTGVDENHLSCVQEGYKAKAWSSERTSYE